MINRPALHKDFPLGSRILKVNHAGEHGAICIYTGQILVARLTARDMIAELSEFKSHEEKHRAIFWAELQRRGQRRCHSYWLCALGGFVLGLGTGLFGRKAIAATTVAVERVVLRHLEHQLAQLRDKDDAAVLAISSIIEDERRHHDHSASHLHDGEFWSRLLSPVVEASTEAVIWIGMRA
ncbi:demethoxyubiquinone hydroxylase family protein [Undibacterium flavidum]|uniref:Demethoxyubiquinone hydroxylase family protein n=1 Tax=Undibacterium flavidum TaxID=2762297 RepID=A0ABR6YAF4_9BURK|nr:demethoxyubiquinone hydroxylase family protein [Undibacterium flavidum]MBC3873571.1 demethoxyubiquinone hydroxylase family protein [Undibacterium flavidum]